MSNYKSNAEWPPDVYEGSVEGDHVTTDTHHSESSALAVCGMLSRQGFGGMGKDYPVKTWVSSLGSDGQWHEILQ